MNKIGLAPTSLPNTPALDYIAAAREGGFEAIGMRFFRSPGLRYGFDPVAGDATRRREVKRALADSGMELLEVLSYYLQPEMDQDSMAPSLELAAELGAKYALVIGDDPEWARMVDNFWAILRSDRSHGNGRCHRSAGLSASAVLHPSHGQAHCRQRTRERRGVPRPDALHRGWSHAG
jgi:hypothetical protein